MGTEQKGRVAPLARAGRIRSVLLSVTDGKVGGRWLSGVGQAVRGRIDGKGSVRRQPPRGRVLNRGGALGEGKKAANLRTINEVG